MGLERIGVTAFQSMQKQGIKMGSLLTLGRQHFAVKTLDIKRVPGLEEMIAANPELNQGEERFAEPFFKAVGVGRVESLDFSAYESCSLVHDLNEPIPAEWHERYDVVFDGGTLEHVFHFPNAIANAMNLVKKGGVFVTATPSNNYNGHGFYQFSPELFFRLFNGANGFEVLMMAFSESTGRQRIFRVSDPAELGKRIIFPGEGPMELVMIAKRCESVTVLAELPQQSDYSATWQQQGEAGEPSELKPSSLKQKIREILPASWLLRYDAFRWGQMHRSRMHNGVQQVDTIDECFLK